MTGRPGKSLTALAALLIALPPLAPAAADGPGERPDIQSEFKRICGQTNQASALSADQLLELIAAGDALLERLEHAGEAGAKVMNFRLARCRDFYRFMLEHLESEDEEFLGGSEVPE